MKRLKVFSIYALVVTLAACADLPATGNEPPITNEEQLVARLLAADLIRSSSAERLDKMRALLADHPEILPFLPHLREYQNGFVRQSVLLMEILNSDDPNDVVRNALRSDDSWRRNTAKQFIGPLLGDPLISDPWLEERRAGIRRNGGIQFTYDILEQTPKHTRERLERDLVNGLLADLREGRVSAMAMSSVLRFLRERNDIGRGDLLAAINVADSLFDERFEQERNRYAVPENRYRRAKESLTLNRVELGDKAALDTLLANAGTSGREDRDRDIALMARLTPTERILRTMIELLGDTEQVSKQTSMNAPPDAKGIPILARDYAAYVVRMWFADAPDSRPHNHVRSETDDQITDLLVWLPRKMAELRIQDQNPVLNDADDDDDGGKL